MRFWMGKRLKGKQRKNQNRNKVVIKRSIDELKSLLIGLFLMNISIMNLIT